MRCCESALLSRVALRFWGNRLHRGGVRVEEEGLIDIIDVIQGAEIGDTRGDFQCSQ